MSVRRSWLPFVVLAVLALAALLIAGSRGVVVRTFALGAPNQAPVAVLKPSGTVCEGPVTSQGPTQSVAVWGASVIGPATLTVNVEEAATGQRLSSGQIEATTTPNEYSARLGKSVPGGRPLAVCLVENVNSFSLLGSPAVRPGVVMSGKRPGLEFSLVLRNVTDQSLLGSLGKAFGRASLFRPSWVGSWTFWLLTLALMWTMPLGAVAIKAASDDDATDEDRAGDHDADLG